MSAIPLPRPRSHPSPAAAATAITFVIANGSADDVEIVVPTSALTLAGFREWTLSDDFPERGRISFLDGEIFIDMSKEALESHNKVKSEISYALMGINKKRKLGEFYIDGCRCSNEEGNVSNVPDAVFASWESLESGRVRFVPGVDDAGEFVAIEGTPDWVLEVVSKSSVRKDTRLLRESYYRAGIPEYWLVDARRDEIAFHILVRGPDGYVDSAEGGGWRTSPLFGRRFRLTRLRNRANHWDYTLRTKALR